MIVFDGLTGNNDRHFYNWGVIDSKKKTSKLPNFAPLYDSARGLLWNVDDQKIKVYLKEYQRYVNSDTKRATIDDQQAVLEWLLKKYNR